MIKIIVMTFLLLCCGMITIFLWIVFFPQTRCQKIKTDSNMKYNVCIKNKSHTGLHMTASGRKFFIEQYKKNNFHGEE